MERKENRFSRKIKEEATKPFNKSFYGRKTETTVGVNKQKPAKKWQPNEDLDEQEQSSENFNVKKAYHDNQHSARKSPYPKTKFSGEDASKKKFGGHSSDKGKHEESATRFSKPRFHKDEADRPAKKYPLSDKGSFTKPIASDEQYEETSFFKKKSIFDKDQSKKITSKRAYEPRKKAAPKGPSMPRVIKDPDDDSIRLNKFISNAGICSRREADELIKAGAVTVNGKVITEMGFKIKRTDLVNYGGQGLKPERQVYILLNKPKDYITTSDDPQERRTVMELIKGACKERVYPVGRLDRNTTGLLLLTNDGELTDKITHPSFKQKKIYHVELDKPVKKEHLKAIQEGIELEDGFIKADEANYVENSDSKNEIGITLHSGRNRIVRRIFEHFEYKVKKLDRVYFAGLTKKDLARGRWRFLTAMEVNMLKMVQ